MSYLFLVLAIKFAEALGDLAQRKLLRPVRRDIRILQPRPLRDDDPHLFRELAYDRRNERAIKSSKFVERLHVVRDERRVLSAIEFDFAVKLL